MLLRLSGIEQNPGPKSTRQTTLDVGKERDLHELITAISNRIDDWGAKLESRFSGRRAGPEKYIEDRKKYLKLLKTKRGKFNKDKINKIKNARDPNLSGALYLFSEKKVILSVDIDMKDWFIFYKKLLNKGDNESFHKANLMISLADGKAAGPDNIPNELLKKLPIPILEKLRTVFNKIMITEKYPEIWTNSIIHPIFKNGDRNNPSNYRGIALCSNMSKLFTSILRNRLNNWIEKRQYIGEKQAEFRKNRSCLDHIFTLNTLIQLSLRKKRGKLYVFFVDLTKAFDTVSHEILWNKLQKMGISSRFISIIKNIMGQQNLSYIERSFPGHILRLETGRISLTATATKLTLKYYMIILEMDEYRLPKLFWNRLKEIVMCGSESSEEIAQDFTMENSVTSSRQDDVHITRGLKVTSAIFGLSFLFYPDLRQNAA
ncbi:hypothetical protein LAZ67_23001182 [Cordylochernes scorpioides]|uniref:Reverse transcriptase domain-containing protein n=1 Tax=Cordylochernes scorpioides TaxID=51811 RepID=A0ABY6LTL8_9ARAC|nr:hypothetical protein LAZ67_23001182 [Cordylochernes scorpioides]